MNIGQAIKELRRRRKIRQQNLAKQVGISQSYLSLVEKGLREPGLDLVGKVAMQLKVPQQLILLMACSSDDKLSHFKRPLANITRSIDEILRKI